MTTTAGISNNAASQSASAVTAKPMSDSSSSTSSSSSTISANDFLTLLVTEMKNQDPTSATDPNQYINQLVSVNSLEQLIQINGTLSGALTTGTSGATSSSQPGLDTPLSGSATDSGVASADISHSLPTTSGNLGIPATNPAAQTLAQALGGRSRLN